MGCCCSRDTQHAAAMKKKSAWGDALKANRLHVEKWVHAEKVALVRDVDGHAHICKYSKYENLEFAIMHDFFFDLFRPKTLTPTMFMYAYIPGMDLYDWVKVGNAVNIEELALSLGTAIEFLHGHGIVHFDVKPENVVMHDNGRRPVLIDFEFADERSQWKENPYHGIRMNEKKGTMGYISPEMTLYGVGSPMCDVWSFGITLVTVLTRTLFFDRDADCECEMRLMLDDGCTDEVQDDCYNRIRRYGYPLGFARGLSSLVCWEPDHRPTIRRFLRHLRGPTPETMPRS